MMVSANNYIAEGDYENSAEILNNIANTDDFAKYEKISDTIFLNTWAKDQYEFTPYEYAELQTYAQGDIMQYGAAVYTARVMIGIENSGSDARLLNPESGNLVKKEHLVNAYPNPTNGLINISSSIELTNARIEIYSLIGKRVGMFKLRKTHSIIDISYLNQGVYLYRIIDNNSIIDVNKIIINK